MNKETESTLLSNAPRLPESRFFCNHSRIFQFFLLVKATCSGVGEMMKLYKGGNNEVLVEKPVSLPLCPLQISHRLNWD